MHTLLRYENAVEDKQVCDKRKISAGTTGTLCAASLESGPTSMCSVITPCRLTKKEAVVQLLDQFFEPVKYTEMGTKWIKHVSAEQCTPIEMKYLEKEVERLLQIRCSRKKPLCVIRDDVLNDLIQELLRQVTIDSPEQGQLLRRILDHFKMEMSAYEVLLRFTDGFVGRKRTIWQHWNSTNARKIRELEEEKRILELQATELKHKVDQLEKRNQESKMKRDAVRMEEIKFLKKRGEHLRLLLEINGA